MSFSSVEAKITSDWTVVRAFVAKNQIASFVIAIAATHLIDAVFFGGRLL